jgi:hypothetical protein
LKKLIDFKIMKFLFLLCSTILGAIVSDRLSVTSLKSSQTAPQPVNFSADQIKDGVMVMIYNKKYIYNRMAHLGSNILAKNTCMFFNGATTTNQLWKLERSLYNDESFLISNFNYTDDRWAYNPQSGTFCYHKGIYKDSSWTFKPVKVNSTDFTIANSQHPTCNMAVWGGNDGSGPQQSGVACDSQRNLPNMGQVFQLKSPFQAASNWQLADLFDNQSNEPAEYNFEFQHGFTETITRSVAKTDSFSMTISLTIKASFFGTGFSNTDSWTVTHSVTSSYQRAMSKSYLRQERIQYKVAPGERICLYQFAVNMKDVISQSGFGFQSTLYKLKACGPISGLKGSVFSELPAGEVLASA